MEGGPGKCLFTTRGQVITMDLLRSKTTQGGLVILTYRTERVS
jgi:hypothetical protein